MNLDDHLRKKAHRHRNRWRHLTAAQLHPADKVRGSVARGPDLRNVDAAAAQEEDLDSSKKLFDYRHRSLTSDTLTRSSNVGMASSYLASLT